MSNCTWLQRSIRSIFRLLTKFSLLVERWSAVCFFVIMLSLAVTVDGQTQKPKDTLTIAISNDFQPFTFLNAEGKPSGLFVDIWRLWGQKTGKKVL